MSYVTPTYFPHTTSMGESDQYSKQVLKWDLLVEVWTTFLQEC
jgi:hypothetical protein